MQIEAIVNHRTGAVSFPGGASFYLALLLRDTLELSLHFVDDIGRTVELASGAVGHLVLKKDGQFSGQARLQKNTWQTVGSGNSRRYKFTVLVWSALLEDDLTADPAQSFALQMEYVIAGKPYQIGSVPTTIAPTYIGPGDVPPPIPLVAYHRPWAREIFGPSEDVDDATRYVGHIDKGGPLKSIRISVATFAAGLTVQLKHNGTNLLTAPLEMTSATMVITDVDDPLLLTRLSVLDGAKIEAVTAFNELSYATRCKGLQIEFTILTDEISAIEVDPSAAFEWLKSHIAGGTRDDEAQTIKLTEIKITGGFAYASINGTNYEWAVNQKA